MNLKDKIRSIARLEDVVERYLPLKEMGYAKKTRVGLCPFHADRHPSLHVNVKEQYYKCFACGEGGDVFTFVQEMEGCDFREALKKLAAWYGVSDTDDWQPVKYPPVRKRQRAKPVEGANPVYVDSLLRNHRMVLGLLEEYVSDNEMLREAYKAFEVGVASSFLPSDYNDLCNRLIFPIRNERGDLVGFAGRYRGDAEGKDIRKYVNSPDSPVYHKGNILYGLYQAQEAIGQHKFVYITEGYKDVLAMHAAGFRNTVAICGTALTEQHAELLGRYTRYAVVMLDGDEAGQTNGLKSARLLAGKGFSVGRIILEPKHDPDSLVCGLGMTAFIDYMEKATRFSRLEVYEADLLGKIAHLVSGLHLALTISERRDLFVRMLPLHKRLGKVTGLLKHSPVMKSDWLLGTCCPACSTPPAGTTACV